MIELQIILLSMTLILDENWIEKRKYKKKRNLHTEKHLLRSLCEHILWNIEDLWVYQAVKKENVTKIKECDDEKIIFGL